MHTCLSLREQIREDCETHSRNFLMPGLHALVLQRVAVWGRHQPFPVRKVVALGYRLVNTVLVRNVYGLELHDTTVIGRRLRIGHHMGVVLGAGVVIGDDVLIRHNVTLGRSVDQGSDAKPRIGNGVQIGAGALVLGGVTVGDGARIGPGAVVMSDVPAGASAFAALARVVRPPAAGAPSRAQAPSAS